MNPISGLIHVTGEHDTGKTVFCLSNGALPKRTVFIDDDIKGRATVKQIGADNFALYVDLVKRFEGKKEAEQHEIILDILKQIDALKGNVDAVVWDTWTRAGKSCHYYVKKYPNRFRDQYSKNGEIKGAEEAAMGNVYEAELLDRLLDTVPLVFVTTHLRDQRKKVSENRSALTGKLEPDARKSLEEKANFRVWLRHNPSGVPMPIGLVLKRPIKWQVTDEGMKPINVLPRKLNPCTWKEIERYWENPVGDREPTETEMPDTFELSILDGTLTDDQKALFNASLVSVNEEEKQETASLQRAFAMPMPQEKTNGAELEGLSLPERLRMLKQQNGE